jgi:hypothetical protein
MGFNSAFKGLNFRTERRTVLAVTHFSPYTACIRRWMSMGGLPPLPNSRTRRHVLGSIDRAARCNSCKLPTWRTILFFICLFQISTCFEHSCAHHQKTLYQYDILYISLVVLRPVCRSMGFRLEEGIFSGCHHAPYSQPLRLETLALWAVCHSNEQIPRAQKWGVQLAPPQFRPKKWANPPEFKNGGKPLVESENGTRFGKCSFVYV